jgi:peptidase M23-like protein
MSKDAIMPLAVREGVTEVGTVQSDPVLLDLPFRGLWLARNSPARRVPSHGTHAFGVTYAIDFIAVDEHGRPAPRTWRSVFAVEPPEVFRGFGEPILAPAGGTVVAAHDGEADHAARRSQVTLVPYALGQRQRVREGAAAIAGNHVVIALGPGGPFVLTAHLRRGTVRVAPGEAVRAGDQIGECGNSGNSTQPHVHVQVTDSVHWPSARGLPMAFRRRHPGGGNAVEPAWMPGESEIVDAGP